MEVIEEYQCGGRIQEVIDLLNEILENHGNVYVENAEGSLAIIELVEESNDRIARIR